VLAGGIEPLQLNVSIRTRPLILSSLQKAAVATGAGASAVRAVAAPAAVGTGHATPYLE
jgi:hypothetical protein